MFRCLIPLAVVAAFAVAQAETPEAHLQETGSSVVLLSHSTFAHGYRHGYEEGYHVGNTDINMGRAPRARLTDLHGVKLGYSPQFGPRRIFDQGFRAGLKAGYGDGYAGRTFRAVETLRSLGDSLENVSLPADPNHTYFDQGFVNGYSSGFEQGGSGRSPAAQVDFHQVNCVAFHPASQRDLPAQGSYCEGYQRGYALGHADGFMLRPEGSSLEASK